MSIIERATSRMHQDAAARQGHAQQHADDAVAAALAPNVVAPAPSPSDSPSRGLPPSASPAAVLRSRGNGKNIELDAVRMQAMGFITAGTRTPLMEEVRVIKRPLITRAFSAKHRSDKPANLIMITSSLPGEGKTFCAINLAMSIAMELDHTVLLVDADVARPSVLRTLGLPGQRGLMELLLDEHADMSELLLHTNIDGLTLLPAGAANARATELLASQAMANLLQEMAGRYPDRIIIFDSPPLLLTTEAHVLAAHMGQIVVVVEAEKTSQHAVQESLRQLEGLHNVNLVYNKTREFPGTAAYDYQYNYSYHNNGQS
ncbi:receptor protein-tyrosine kinase [Duganella sp. CF517]|uniref:XrtA-associated tyrosine autokinase n=1 Tax=Duganella sp. CF517 TaxID=1881038 RepID=UPI0008C141BC|nr:XrtA-associated tyrosine autokinase [Duganella sp. CF517]SEN85104.1 receptor protein-tyrosine kinase [Duganella sp. CF517]